MRKKIKIGNCLLGESELCFIIAEAGVNHNGSLGLAKKLVDGAKEVGVDAIKFQTFKAEDLVAKKTEMVAYQRKNVGKKESQFEMLKKLELTERDFIELKKYCDKKGIIFLSTPHTEDAIDFLESLVPVYKIGSGDLTNLPFLEKVARKQKPIILSTGMATLNEIREAVNTIKKERNNKIILLHCTTNYPCPLEEVNLRAMLTLKKEFNLPIGYSDHTFGILVPIMAVAMGAKIIEKHFTLDKNLPGPDHKASLEPKELKEMVESIRNVEKALGNGIKRPTKNEEKIKSFVRKTIVAKVNIPKGIKITKEMLSIKRAGVGIEPKYLKKIIGKVAKKNIVKEEIITWGKI
jgi:N-acetylneuraminate synthase/N,N'-diacetyllegionaminate synthase